MQQSDAGTLGWFRAAAEHGHAEAQNNIGTLYEIGKGVTQDMNEAKQWYRKAAEQGDESVGQNLQRLG